MFKKPVLLLTAIVLSIVMLVACGSAGTTTTQPETTAAAATTVAETTAAAAETTATEETTAADSQETTTQATTLAAATQVTTSTLAPVTDAPDESKYGELLTFTVASLDYPDGFDDYPLVTEAKSLFNIEFVINQVPWDVWGETIRTQAATNTLPEVIAWYDLNFAEYRMWAEQGVYIPFPEDLSPWPHLKHNLDQLAVVPYLMVNGRLYCNPKINHNQPIISAAGTHFINDMTKIRRDWALALGYDWGLYQEVDFDEMLSFLRDVRDKDPGEVGEYLIPFDPDGSGQGWVNVVRWWNGNITEYYKTDDGTYEWGARDPSSLEGIMMLNSMYKEGLLYRDGYADFVAEERFQMGGRVAVQYGALAVHELTGNANNLMALVPGFTDEGMGSISIRLPDGKFHHRQMNQYWAAFAFSNHCTEEIMERWLDMGNWLLEEDQVEKYAYGIYGEDWTKDADGNVTVKWAAEDLVRGNSKYYIAGQRAFQKFFMLEGADLWLPGNPALRPILQEGVYLDFFRGLSDIEARGEMVYTPIDFNVQFVEGQNKDQYGAFGGPTRDAVMQAVVSDDPEAVWNTYLNETAPLADAVLAEINGALVN